MVGYATGWTKPASLGKLGAAPGGDVVTNAFVKTPEPARRP